LPLDHARQAEPQHRAEFFGVVAIPCCGRESGSAGVVADSVFTGIFDSKIAHPDSNESQPGTMIFARLIFFTDSFSGLRRREVQLGPRVAALQQDSTPVQRAPISL
jgi:hypothetical protein